MRRVVSCLLCLTLAALAAAMFACLLPARPAWPETATWNPARLLETLAREQRRREDLDEATLAAYHCRDAKHAVVAQLVGGRMSLAEAAARFQELDAANPGPGVRPLRQTWPSASDEELYCRSVLLHVEAYLDMHPESGRRALEGLRAELDDRLRRRIS